MSEVEDLQVSEKEKFKLKKDMLALEVEAYQKKHKMRMEELAFFRETERLKHEWELERNRIKSAEIRKNHMRKFGMDPYKQ